MAYEWNDNSIVDLLNKASRAHAEGRVHRGSDSDSVCRSGFVGRSFESWADCANKTNEPWLEGLTVIEELMSRIRHESLPTPTSRRRKMRFGEQGDEIDFDRLRAGDEKYWHEAFRENVRAPQTLTLFCNVAASYNVGSRDVFYRGAVGIVLADLLSQAGFSVELYLVSASSGAFRSGDDLIQTVCLKKAEAPVDTATIANAMSGWFLRSVIFQSRYADPTKKPSSNLGHPMHIHAGMPELTNIAGPNSTTVAIDGIWNLHAAVELVRGVLALLRAESQQEQSSN